MTTYTQYLIMEELIKRRDIFCHHYVVDYNGARAAREAGYATDTAASEAHRLLKDPNVKQRIRELTDEKIRRTKIDAEAILVELWLQQQAEISELMDEEGNMLPLHELPAHWQRMITSIEVESSYATEYNEEGDTFEKVKTVVRKYKLPDKTKLLELLGKHVNVKAFVERVEDVGNIEQLAERLKVARSFRKKLAGPN